jgi:uncharacterized membrane protein YcaP (DUF421 family)
MKKEEILPWDWQRILFGQAPANFLLEVFLKTIVIYLLLLIILRLMGRRMDSQMTLTEMGVVILLGAVISVPIQIPDRGLILTVVALVVVLGLQQLMNWLSVKSETFEEATSGTMSVLVRDGKLQLDEMHRAGITQQQVFSGLRGKQIFSLGKVKRLYFEACGLMSIYRETQAKAGLPIFPPGEENLVRKQSRIAEDKMACMICGNVEDNRDDSTGCKNCGSKKWMEAIY